MIIGLGPYCKTKDQHPQTYITPQGDARYYLKTNKDLHGVWTLPADLKSTKNGLTPTYTRRSTSVSRRTVRVSTTCSAAIRRAP